MHGRTFAQWSFPKSRTVIKIRVRTVVRLAIVISVLAASLIAFVPRQAPAQTLPAPVLEPFNGKWHTPSYLLRGEVARARFLSFVRVLRDGVVIDSVSTAVDSLFSVRVPLEPGPNQFTAVWIDTSLTSPPSNTVNVTFDTSAGFFMPVPFVAGASFDINVTDPVGKVVLRVFDVMGDLVTQFESREQRTFYSFPWDGLNASGERVHRGPLIAVAAIDYSDGSHEVIRRAFLFDSDGAP